MIGALIPVRIHGTVLSSLFARCISRNAADPGTANILESGGVAGFPG